MSNKAPGRDGRPDSDELGGVIERAKRQLEHMIDLNPESIVLVDRGGVVLRVNRAFLALLGVREFADVLGRPLLELVRTPDADLLATVLRGAAGGDGCECRIEIGGLPRLLRITSAGAESNDVLVLIVQDVTDARRDAELVEKAYKVEAVRTLMGALMHHLNQPLTVVMIRARLQLQALEEQRSKPEDIMTTLQDIMKLTMKVADVLRRVENSRDYATQEYIQGVDIMRIDPE